MLAKKAFTRLAVDAFPWFSAHRLKEHRTEIHFLNTNTSFSPADKVAECFFFRIVSFKALSRILYL